ETPSVRPWRRHSPPRTTASFTATNFPDTSGRGVRGPGEPLPRREPGERRGQGQDDSAFRALDLFGGQSEHSATLREQGSSRQRLIVSGVAPEDCPLRVTLEAEESWQVRWAPSFHELPRLVADHPPHLILIFLRAGWRTG